MSSCGCGQTKCCQTEFQYAVKVLCAADVSAEKKTPPIAPGAYFTAINIHNPSKCCTCAFRWKVAQAKPAPAIGIVTQFSDLSLGPDEAVEIDNEQILQLYRPLPLSPASRAM